MTYIKGNNITTIVRTNNNLALKFLKITINDI